METEEQIRRFQEKPLYFRGSAKIHLKNLQFEIEDIPGGRTLDPKNVARLIRIFNLEGCLRLDMEHHIPAIINEDVLRRGIARSDIRRSEMFKCQSPPFLNLNTSALRCLHGRHRITAAKEFLLPGDKWWTVDLYSEGL